MAQLAPLPRARIGARAVYRVILCPDCAGEHLDLSPQVVYERVTGENPTPFCHGCGAEIEEPEHDTSDRPRPRSRPPPARAGSGRLQRPGVIHNRQNFRRAPRGFTQRNAVRVGSSENENDERGGRAGGVYEACTLRHTHVGFAAAEPRTIRLLQSRHILPVAIRTFAGAQTLPEQTLTFNAHTFRRPCQGGN